jgi:hypothetical protein
MITSSSNDWVLNLDVKSDINLANDKPFPYLVLKNEIQNILQNRRKYLANNISQLSLIKFHVFRFDSGFVAAARNPLNASCTLIIDGSI